MTTRDDRAQEPWRDTRQTNAMGQVSRAKDYRDHRLPGVALPDECPVDTLIRVIEEGKAAFSVSTAHCRALGWLGESEHGSKAVAMMGGIFVHRQHLVRAERLEPGLANVGAIAALLPEDEFAFTADRYTLRVVDLTGQRRDLRMNASEWLVRLWDARWVVYTDEEFHGLYEPFSGD
jgi:hypothetical protein